MTIEKKTQVEDWKELHQASQMVREASGERRKEVIEEVFIPLLKNYNTKYGRYDPLNKPNGNY